MSTTETFWKNQVNDEGFRSIFSGKEIGHRIADYVDEHTTEMLSKKIETKQQVHKSGKAMPRSMGDIWIESNGILNPLNVKAGEAGKNGQPNLVALRKLLGLLLTDTIDSYYLLIVKMKIKGRSIVEDVELESLTPEAIEPKIYLVDMLDYLDFVTFDSGPGQLMLKEKQFYESMSNTNSVLEKSLAVKISHLVELREDGDRRLFENRKKTLDKMRREVDKYAEQTDHTINQEGLSFG